MKLAHGASTSDSVAETPIRSKPSAATAVDAMHPPIDFLVADSEELQRLIAAVSLSSSDNNDVSEQSHDAHSLVALCAAALREHDVQRQRDAADLLRCLICAVTSSNPAKPDDEGESERSVDNQEGQLDSTRLIDEICAQDIIDSLVPVALASTEQLDHCAMRLLISLVGQSNDAKTQLLHRLSYENHDKGYELSLLVLIADTSSEFRTKVADHCMRVLTDADATTTTTNAIVELLITLHTTGSTATSELVLQVMNQLKDQAGGRPIDHGRSCAVALVRLAAKPALVEPLVEAGIISICIKPLKSLLDGRPSKNCVSGDDSLAILSSISQSWDFGGLLLDEGAVTLLVSLVLTTTAPHIQLHCVEILSTIAWTDEPTRQVVAVTGCLDIFIDMLRSNDARIRDTGVGAIAAVCRENQANVARVPVENALATCVEMLQPGSSSHTKTMALRLITSLVEDDVVGEDVARHGEIVDLALQQLTHGFLVEQLQAVLAIGGLVQHRASRERLQLMSIESTLQNLEHETSELAEYASLALVELREPLPERTHP